MATYNNTIFLFFSIFSEHEFSRYSEYWGLKERSRLLPETVDKLITIQQDSALQLQLCHDYKQELAKWTHEDEHIKLDKDIQKSRDARVLQFKNYIEEW